MKDGFITKWTLIIFPFSAETALVLLCLSFIGIGFMEYLLSGDIWGFIAMILLGLIVMGCGAVFTLIARKGL